MSKSSSNANRKTSGVEGERERERERERREEGRGEREDERRWERRGFEGCTSAVPERRKCMAMHYLARPVLVLFIKEHGRSNTAAFTEKMRESWRNSLNDTSTSFSLQA